MVFTDRPIPCNSGLGFFQDDPEFLRRAIAYLEVYSDPPSVDL